MAVTDVDEKTAEPRNRIFFVNRFYWPDESATSQLLTDLAENLAANGADVIVITSRLNYARPKVHLSRAERHNGVQIHRVWTTAFHRRSIFGRMLDFLTFYLFSTLTLLRWLRPGDMVIAKTDPPLIQICAWFATRVKRARLVNWCQDLFPEILAALNMQNADGTLGALMNRLRNFALQHSEMNVTISGEMRKTLLAQGIDEDRVCVIRNWCDRLIVPISREINTLNHQWELQDKFVIGYSGNLGRAHIADKVYALIEGLTDIRGVKFVFIGSGYGMGWLKEECRRAGHQNVVFKSYQPRPNLSQSLSLPDLHLISLGRRFNEFLAPSKFYGILAAGRPVAFLGDPNCDMAREIDELRLGLILDIDDKLRWRHQIVDLIKDRAQLTAMASNARRAHESRFEARYSLDAWQQIIQPPPQFVDNADSRQAISTMQ